MQKLPRLLQTGLLQADESKKDMPPCKANCVDVGHEKEVWGEQTQSSGGGSNWSVVAGSERRNNLGKFRIVYFVFVYLIGFL